MGVRVEEDGDVLILEDPAKLRTLASLLLHQEEELMVAMTSERERVEYLQKCNESYDGVIKLIDGIEDFRNKTKEVVDNNNTKHLAGIAEDIHKYIKYGLNMSMQWVRNCSLRVQCIRKIDAHFNDLVRVVRELHPDDIAGAQRLAEEVTLYKQYMLDYTDRCRSSSARAFSKIYSLACKEQGVTFSKLVNTHKMNLGFEGEFQELEEAQKLMVYNNIIEESGRAAFPKLEIISTSVGVVVLVTAAALVVYDIYEAENKIEAIVRNTLNVASEIGAFAVQVAVETALVATLIEVELGATLVCAASGFVAGMVAGLIFMAATGAFLDLFFCSGGTIEPHMIGIQFRKLEMPDGMAIAYLLSHDH